MFPIVVAEDEPWIRSGISEMIENIGGGFYVVGEAVDGEDAWNMLLDLWPVFIVTDIVMPRRDGMWLVEQIHSHGLPMIPIIISGYDNFEYAQQAMRFNVVDFLLKPFGEEQLKNALNRAMDRLSLLQPVHDYVLEIQEFIDRMEQMDYQPFIKQLTSLIKSIYDAKKLDKKARISLMRILSGKIYELMPDMEANPMGMLRFPEASDFDQIRKFFLALAELWMQRRSTHAPAESKLILQKVCNYLEKNYMKNITVGEMAKYASLSDSHFRHLFKQHTGATFVNYLNEVRISKAKELLLEDDLKIYEVSEMTGFISQPYFNRMFKEKAGMTPAEYRKRVGL